MDGVMIAALVEPRPGAVHRLITPKDQTRGVLHLRRSGTADPAARSANIE
jgi:hypothetical protein